MSQTWVAMSERCKYGSHGRKESDLSRRLQVSVVDSPVVKDEQHPLVLPRRRLCLTAHLNNV
jgi:hypothetical protein